ncbi:hypothetical protein [Verrucosispora sioxanthis]|uniref:Uncharacterized protein n=1 Tax=Verrucosispora sioxanthis TaxID=2499994 RepID=A0A6M1L9T5_9ACTN|nr:hypothetical protein [Verrucosispora sioxanthis]NEE65915.1 hypothetical protein [Verrucosispora sioxanthis]NGM15025.1 hypothetical protein [Verrucosispora sioxanthis]
MSIIFAIASPDLVKLVYALLVAIMTGTISAVVLIIKNWCKLLSGTYAVMHADEQRRADARLVYERALDNHVEMDDPLEVEAPIPLAPPLGRWRGRRRRRRRRR